MDVIKRHRILHNQELHNSIAYMTPVHKISKNLEMNSKLWEREFPYRESTNFKSYRTECSCPGYLVAVVCAPLT